MKDKNELEDFLQSHEIAQAVAEQIKSGKTANDGYLNSPYSKNKEEFINNISSEECFESNYKMLEDAYQRRNITGFEKRLNAKETTRIKRRKMRITLISSSVAAAVILFSVLLLNKQDKEVLVEEISKVSNVVAEVNVPTLITTDSVIRLNCRESSVISANFTKYDEMVDKSERRLVVPKGYTYRVILSDSSEVTLNANSELSYPNAFYGDNREVTLKGEAFFSVSKGEKPFIVNVENVAVKVFGTKFNINSYNENNVQAVLVSGSVGVTIKNGSDNGIKMIKPNQLMTIDSKGNNKLMNVDAGKYIAWMSGDIVSNGDKLIYFLDNIAKWYGVEFECSDDIKDIHISAEVKNSRPLDEVLRSIELISNVKIVEMKNNKYMIRK